MTRRAGAASPGLNVSRRHTFFFCKALAQCLKKQQKTAEALPYARRALDGQLKTLGKDHALTQESQKPVNALTQPAPKA